MFFFAAIKRPSSALDKAKIHTLKHKLKRKKHEIICLLKLPQNKAMRKPYALQNKNVTKNTTQTP